MTPHVVAIIAALVIAIVGLEGESRAATILTDEEMEQLTGDDCGAAACSCTGGANDCYGSGRRTCGGACGGGCPGDGSCDWCACKPGSSQCSRGNGVKQCGTDCCSADNLGNCKWCSYGGVSDCNSSTVNCSSDATKGCNAGSSCSTVGCGTICTSGGTKPCSGQVDCTCRPGSSACNKCDDICSSASNPGDAECSGTKCCCSVSGGTGYCPSGTCASAGACDDVDDWSECCRDPKETPSSGEFNCPDDNQSQGPTMNNCGWLNPGGQGCGGDASCENHWQNHGHYTDPLHKPGCALNGPAQPCGETNNCYNENSFSGYGCDPMWNPITHPESITNYGCKVRFTPSSCSCQP